jgi:hypothetical protein
VQLLRRGHLWQAPKRLTRRDLWPNTPSTTGSWRIADRRAWRSSSPSAIRLVPVVDGGTSRCLSLSLPPPRLRLTTASDDKAARCRCCTRGCLRRRSESAARSACVRRPGSERPFRPLEAGVAACSSYAEATYRKRRNASPDATYGRILHPHPQRRSQPRLALPGSCAASAAAIGLVPVVDGGTSRCLPLSLPPPRSRLTTASDDEAAHRPCCTRARLEPAMRGVVRLRPEPKPG